MFAEGRDAVAGCPGVFCGGPVGSNAVAGLPVFCATR